MKILVIRFSSLGDIVLTTPIVRALKHQLDCELHYCTKKDYQYLFEENPYVDKVHSLTGSLYSLIRSLRKENFDYVIDLHHNLRTLLVKVGLGGKHYSFNKLNISKWLFVKLKINRLPNVHIVERYFEAVSALEVKKDGQGLDYFIPERDVIENNWLPESHQDGYIVYALGGKYSTKRLPIPKMIELCDKINKPIILIGGKEDFDRAEEVKSFFDRSDSDTTEGALEQLNKKAVLFNSCGKFNVNQSASIIKNASVVFSHDTGMMHIAAAFRKNIYSIWGNTVPEFGMYPYLTQFTIFENKKIKCRPCSKIGFKNCPKGHFKCMNDQTFDFYLP